MEVGSTTNDYMMDYIKQTRLELVKTGCEKLVWIFDHFTFLMPSITVHADGPNTAISFCTAIQQLNESQTRCGDQGSLLRNREVVIRTNDLRDTVAEYVRTQTSSMKCR